MTNSLAVHSLNAFIMLVVGMIAGGLIVAYHTRSSDKEISILCPPGWEVAESKTGCIANPIIASKLSILISTIDNTPGGIK